MQILIQHRQTGLYLSIANEWSANPSHAEQFASASEAVEQIRQRRIEPEAQVVWKSPTGPDWVMWPDGKRQ